MILQAISNQQQPLKEWILLPNLGLVLIVLSVLFWYRQRYEYDFGPKALWIPLLIIACSIAISSLSRAGELGVWKASGYAMWGFLLFGVYGIARSVGRKIFTPFIYGMVFAVVGMVYYAFFHTGQIGRTGGWISPTNYDIGAGVLIIGLLVSSLQRRWWIAAIIISAVILTGAQEGFFAIGCLLVAVLIRKDFSKRLLVTGACVVGVVLILVATGNFANAFQQPLNALKIDIGQQNAVNTAYVYADGTKPTGADQLFHGRISLYKYAIQHMTPIGHGYKLGNFDRRSVHNVPLMVADQVGPIAGLAFLWVLGYLFLKSKWKYAVIGVIALGVFDHYLWSQIPVFTYALIGVASASTVKSDLVFKRAEQ
jgi:hypothetical protein